MDYISKIYKEVSESKELLELKNQMKNIDKNIKNKDFVNIISLFDCNVLKNLSNRVEESMRNIITELLSEEIESEEIKIYESRYDVGIRIPFEKIHHYNYTPNASSSPSSYLLKVDFKNKQIINYNTKKDYEIAEHYLQLNMEEDRGRIEKQREIVEKLEDIKDAKQYLKENPSVYNTSKYLKLCFSAKMREKYDEIFFDMKKREKRYLDGIEEYFKEREDISFANDYSNSVILKEKILEKLEPLKFGVFTEEVEEY